MSVHVSAALQVLPVWLVLQSVIHTQFKNHGAEQSSQAVHPQPQCRKDIVLPQCSAPTAGAHLSATDRNKGTDAQHLGYPSEGNPQSPQMQQSAPNRQASMPRGQYGQVLPPAAQRGSLRRLPPAQGSESPAARPAGNWASRGLLHPRVIRPDNSGPDPPDSGNPTADGPGLNSPPLSHHRLTALPKDGADASPMRARSAASP